MTTNVGTQKVLTLDGYTSGEKPRPFTVRLDLSAIDISSGYTVDATYEDNDGTELVFAGTVTIFDGANGIIEVTLDEADLTLGAGIEHETRRLMVWTGNLTMRLATLLIKVPINAAVGTPPTI